MAKYSLATSVKELFETEETLAVLKEVMPALVDGPMAGMVKGLPMSMKDVLGFAGGKIPAEKVEELEKRLEQLG